MAINPTNMRITREIIGYFTVYLRLECIIGAKFLTMPYCANSCTVGVPNINFPEHMTYFSNMIVTILLGIIHILTIPKCNLK